MYKYNWYLVSNEDLPAHLNLKDEWVLVCPDFPKLYISDTSLDENNWNSDDMINKATDLTRFALCAMVMRGDTIPNPQQAIEERKSFEVVISLE